MLRLTLAVVLLGVALSLRADPDSEWKAFKVTYNKHYKGQEEVRRHMIFGKNLRYIERHNAEAARGEHTFTLGTNEYADMTNKEFVSIMNGYRSDLKVHHSPVHKNESIKFAPASVDWRTKGYVTPIKNQGQCGSCWAFSSTGSLEGQHYKKAEDLVSLSESNLVDCSRKQGNMGCEGGLMDQAFQYIKVNKGIDTEKSYPYKPKNEKCKFNRANVGATDHGYVDITSGSESALQNAVASVGPISVAIDASHPSFQLYRNGIYNEPRCSPKRLDHGVLAVGYSSKGGTDYWIVKNSWGTSWGNRGYIWMSRNKDNQCGIATQASYPSGV